MEHPDVRWKQRFQNFEKAMSFLEKAIAIKNPDEIQRAGLIQFFEMSFELSWNLLKDYLVQEGYAEIKSPLDAIKKAFEIDMIKDGHTWLKILNDRNLMSHAYDEAAAIEVEKLIRIYYYNNLKDLYQTFKKL